MSWDEYWYGDYTRLPFYRKAYALKREETNQKLWMQGVYFLRAIGCAFFENETYPEEPLPLTDEDAKEQEERRRRIEIDNARAYMEVAMHNINKQRREQKGGDQHG